MTDYSELQRAAEAVKAMDYPWEHTIRDGRLGKTSTQYARLAHPSNVLALLAENKRLAALLECAQGDCRQAMQISEKSSKDAERYRFIRTDVSAGKVDICIIQKNWSMSRDDYLSLEKADEAIDAAMSKEPSNG